MDYNRLSSPSCNSSVQRNFDRVCNNTPDEHLTDDQMAGVKRYMERMEAFQKRLEAEEANRRAAPPRPHPLPLRHYQYRDSLATSSEMAAPELRSQINRSDRDLVKAAARKEDDIVARLNHDPVMMEKFREYCRDSGSLTRSVEASAQQRPPGAAPASSAMSSRHACDGRNDARRAQDYDGTLAQDVARLRDELQKTCELYRRAATDALYYESQLYRIMGDMDARWVSARRHGSQGRQGPPLGTQNHRQFQGLWDHARQGARR